MDQKITPRASSRPGIKTTGQAGRARAKSAEPPRGPERISHARSAWRERNRIFSSQDRPAAINDLLLEVKVRDHEAYSVSAAAFRAGVSVRHLHRLCMTHLGQPPGTVIDLARALSISVALTTTEDAIQAIARSHGFHRQSDMNRFFNRFIGSTPRFFRARSTS